jgi:hypothetical protein
VNYAGRVDHLLHGGGLSPVLDASTVFDDMVADVLEGGQGQDLFFADALDLLPDWNSKKEEMVAVGKG